MGTPNIHNIISQIWYTKFCLRIIKYKKYTYNIINLKPKKNPFAAINGGILIVTSYPVMYRYIKYIRVLYIHTTHI